MTAGAARYFGARAAAYDSLVHRAIPVYGEMVDRLVLYAPEAPRRILELGCGTGNLSIALARSFPDSELTVVDGSPEMLSITAERLAGDMALDCVHASFEELQLRSASFDLVTSCLSLHHLAALRDTFARVFDALVPGGRLVYADQMGAAKPEHFALNYGRMVDFWRSRGHLDETEIESLEDHVRDHDHYQPIAHQLEELAAVGFEELDVVWRSWMWGVVTAARPVARG